MNPKLLKITLCTAIFLTTVYASAALAEGGGEGGGNVQTPVQVIVQIAVTAAVLKVLDRFNLP